MTAEGKRTRRRALLIARKAALAGMVTMGLVGAQLSVQMGAAGNVAQAAEKYTVSVSTDGYGADRHVDYTYDKSRLSLENAEFTTTNPGSSPADGGKLGFELKKDKKTRIAYSRAATTYQFHKSAIVLIGNTKPGTNKVSGSFGLVWRKAVKDAYGKSYDLHMTVSNVSVENPTKLTFQNGVAIMQGTFVEQGEINSTEKLSTKPENPTTKRDLYRVRTVNSSKPFTALTSASDDDEEEEEESDQGSTSFCAWVCNYNGSVQYRNIERLHEAFYTSVRKGDTWDGKTWISKKTGKTYTSKNKKDDDDTKDWKANNGWTDALSGADNLSDNEVGAKMKVSSFVTPAKAEGLAKSTYSEPVKGGTLGMGFRDIDQPALGRESDDYTVGTYMESITFESGFLAGDGSSKKPVVHVNEGTTLKSGGKALSDGKSVSRLHGGKRTTKADSKDAGFTCKVDASGFAYSWAGARCATPLFTPTRLDGAIDIPIEGKKTVNGAIPGSAREGAFAFRLYFKDPAEEGKETAVKSWSSANEKLDSSGKVTAGAANDGNKQATVTATNAKDGSFGFHLNYWTLRHALGYAKMDDLISATGDEGIFEKDFKFDIVENTAVDAMKDGGYLATKGSAGFTLRLSSDGRGGATCKVTYDDGELALIENEETAAVQISVAKRLLNETGLPSPDISGKYSFVLGAASEGAPLPADTGTQAVNPDADGGEALFGAFRISEPGDYLYKVTESRTQGVAGVFGVKDDPSASTGKSVKVHVYRQTDSEGASHTLATVSASDPEYAHAVQLKDGSKVEGVIFWNSYDPPTLQIPVTKILEAGTGAPDIAGRFAFKLTAPQNASSVDGDPAQPGSGKSATAPLPQAGEDEVVNPDSTGGTASFGTIVYTSPGTYRYQVTESGSVYGVENDENATKDVEVVVGQDGSVTVNGGAPVSFTNVYKSSVAMPLAGGDGLAILVSALGVLAVLAGVVCVVRRRKRVQ